MSKLLKKLALNFDEWVKGWNPYRPEQISQKGLKPVEIEESRIRKQAFWWFFSFLLIFVGWAVFAPIDGGVTVQGTVEVSGYRKAVQHPQGGVVEDILVREGEHVEKGKVLLRINPLKNEADVTATELELINVLVTESRLLAEQHGATSITWSKAVQEMARDPRVVEAKTTQQDLFDSKRGEYRNQIAALEAEMTGLVNSSKSYELQLETLTQEYKNNLILEKEGFATITEVNNILRDKAQQQMALANAQSSLAKSRAEMARLKTSFLKDVDRELSDVQTKRDALESQLRSARFDRMLAELKAPVTGTVIGMTVFTIGGVIQSGAVLMEIVPDDMKLKIDAPIPGNVIDKVKIGLPTDLRFVAFNVNTTPVVPGTVTMVTLDKTKLSERLTQERQEFYKAEVEVTPEGMKMLGDIKVQPGMPVDVIVKTGERTFMSYLLKPLSDKFARAFKN